MLYALIAIVSFGLGMLAALYLVAWRQKKMLSVMDEIFGEKAP